MLKVLTTALLALTFSGCAMIPSFWDDNQSAKIVDVRQSVEQLDCSKPHAPQVKTIKNNIEWFEMYSESKGARQQDVIALIDPMKETVDDFYKRSTEKQGSKVYCEAKKRVMKKQASIAAEAVLGRF